MQTIHLPRKKIKKFILDGKELVLSLDAMSVSHFQRANKKGFLKLLEELQTAQDNGDAPILEMIQLLGSCCHYKGNPVGTKFFKDYDEFEIVKTLVPMLFELFEENLPKAKGKSEKK